MIIVKIYGGLGNQLFQYAAAKSLAHKHLTEVKLDLTHFTSDELRNFSLDAFHMHVGVANPDEINKLNAKNLFSRVQSKLTPVAFKKFYKEVDFNFNKKFKNLGKHVYIKGYFQSELYFKEIQDLLKKEFTLKKDFVANVKHLGDKLHQEESISIHIRRGDYKNNTTAKYHGILPLSYYYDAISLIRKKILNPKFYIFSDDIDWVTNNLKIEGTSISGNITQTQYEDFFLMSQCKHNIIANSSFSWWAAWLNSNPNKIVIAPNKWFNEAKNNTKDLIPASWIKL